MHALMIIPNSENRKTGKGVATTYRPVDVTCPTCAMAKYCYAKRGCVQFQQKHAATRNDDFALLAGVPLVRHLVSGDGFRKDAHGRRYVDRAFWRELIAFHKANPDVIGWGYTHGAEQLQRAGFGPDSFPSNVTIFASCEDAARAKRLQAAGWHTARVIHSPEERMANEVYCPYDFAKFSRRSPSITCKQCRLCWDSVPRNIAFMLDDGSHRARRA